jgi:gliding motility-associated-like protein
VYKRQGGTPPYQFSIDNLNFQSSSQFIGLGAGAYPVTVRDANNCSVTLDIFSTIVLQPFSPLEIASLSTTPQACTNVINGRIDINAAGGTPPYRYTLFSPTGVPIDTYPFDSLRSGTYRLTVSDQYGCSVTEDVTIGLRPALALKARKADPTCFNLNDGSIGVEATGGMPPYNYSWSHDNSLVDTLAANLSPGLYTITVTDAAGCQAFTNVTINAPTRVDAGPDLAFCLDRAGNLPPVRLTGQSPSNGFWTGPGIVPGTTRWEYTRLNAPGTYTLTYTWFGCSDTRTITVGNVDAGPNDIICSNLESYPLPTTAQPSGGVWLYNADTVTTPELPLVNIRQSSFQLVYLSPLGCRDTITVTLKDPARAYFLIRDSILELPFEREAQFINRSRGASVHIWDFGDSTQVTEFEPRHVYSRPDTFVVTLMAIDSSGCASTYQDTVYVIDGERGLELPNAFSPNGDFRNDEWLVNGANVLWHQYLIFDRWGNIIWRQDALPGGQSRWPGLHYNDLRPVPEGVYTYVIEYTFYFNPTRIRKQAGTITVLR